jgi:hypothetical protein
MENPYSTYRVIIPYTCSFTIPDENTTVTIKTESQSICYGRNRHDVELQMELNEEHSESTYAKHILKYVSNYPLRAIDPKTVDVEYDSAVTITQMTNEEIDDYRNECLEDE